MEKYHGKTGAKVSMLVEDVEDNLVAVPVRHKRGRPRNPPPTHPTHERPAGDVLSATCRCLRCDVLVEESEVCEALPVYC